MRIRMRVRWNGKVAQFLIPFTVNPEKWNKATNRCVANTTHGKDKVSASEINRTVQIYEDAADDILQTDLSADEFKNKFNVAVGKTEYKSEEISLIELLDLFTLKSGKENTWSERTYKHFISLKNHLLEYNENLTNELTEDDLAGFVEYMQSKRAVNRTYKNATRGLSNKTANKYLSFLRWFLKWAKQKGYYSGNLHETFKPKLTGAADKKKVIFLSWDELTRLYDFDFKNKSLDQVRDVFCFCCFTSLRYSDVANLRRKDVFENYISVVTQKTHEELRIDLNDFSKAILKKHEEYVYRDNLALPVISNQKMNTYLKEIGRILEFDEPINIVTFVGSKRYEDVFPKYELLTTHCGRRTFIVNALYLGIPAEVVMRWTGHEDYNSMKPYIAIVDELKNKEMDKFNRKVPHNKK